MRSNHTTLDGTKLRTSRFLTVRSTLLKAGAQCIEFVDTVTNELARKPIRNIAAFSSTIISGLKMDRLAVPHLHCVCLILLILCLVQVSRSTSWMKLLTFLMKITQVSQLLKALLVILRKVVSLICLRNEII